MMGLLHIVIHHHHALFLQLSDGDHLSPPHLVAPAAPTIVVDTERTFPLGGYLLADMAQVTQSNNPLQDGINGKGKDRNSKYESNWEPVVGARRFFNNVKFRIKASWAGKDEVEKCRRR